MCFTYSNFLTLYKKYEWLICIRKFHPFLFLKPHTQFCKFSLVKHFIEKTFLISSLIEISFCKGILPKDSYTKVSHTVLRLASRWGRTLIGVCMNVDRVPPSLRLRGMEITCHISIVPTRPFWFSSTFLKKYTMLCPQTCLLCSPNPLL